MDEEGGSVEAMVVEGGSTVVEGGSAVEEEVDRKDVVGQGILSIAREVAVESYGVGDETLVEESGVDREVVGTKALSEEPVQTVVSDRTPVEESVVGIAGIDGKAKVEEPVDEVVGEVARVEEPVIEKTAEEEQARDEEPMDEQATETWARGSEPAIVEAQNIQKVSSGEETPPKRKLNRRAKISRKLKELATVEERKRQEKRPKKASDNEESEEDWPSGKPQAEEASPSPKRRPRMKFPSPREENEYKDDTALPDPEEIQGKKEATARVEKKQKGKQVSTSKAKKVK